MTIKGLWISNKEKVLQARDIGLERDKKVSEDHRFAYQEGTIY